MTRPANPDKPRRPRARRRPHQAALAAALLVSTVMLLAPSAATALTAPPFPSCPAIQELQPGEAATCTPEPACDALGAKSLLLYWLAWGDTRLDASGPGAVRALASAFREAQFTEFLGASARLRDRAWTVCQQHKATGRWNYWLAAQALDAPALTITLTVAPRTPRSRLAEHVLHLITVGLRTSWIIAPRRVQLGRGVSGRLRLGRAGLSLAVSRP